MVFCVVAFLCASAVSAGELSKSDPLPQVLQYGPYHTATDKLANSYFVFTPPNSTQTKFPVILEIHGGGFTGGTATSRATPAVQDALANGIAWVSINYRLVATKYFYTNETTGQEHEEELIHVSDDGKLALDTAGQTMSHYNVRRGRQEFNTKCSYDAAKMIDHLVAHADELRLDVHRISLTGGSAGGGEIHYLTWVYHAFHSPPQYTPVGMVYTMAQLDYPVQNMLDRVWGLWADDVGGETALSTILSYHDCPMIVGNPWCAGGDGGPSDYNLCNATYQAQALGRFCASETLFNAATLDDARAALVWPANDAEVGKGMEVLWYNSLNMQKHSPTGYPGLPGSKPFYLYIANHLNSTAGMNVVHNSLYGRQYARYAASAPGIEYTTYYTDYEAMTSDDVGSARFEVDQGREGATVYNYRSSHDWVGRAGVNATGRTSAQEQLLYHCLAFGIDDCVPAGPVPPSPAPPPTPMTQACKDIIAADCPAPHTTAGCNACVRAHAKVFVGAGCPTAAQGGEKDCAEYCESLGL